MTVYVMGESSMTLLSWNLLFLHLVLLRHFPIGCGAGKYMNARVYTYVLVSTFDSMLTVTMEPSGVLQLCPGSNVTFTCTNNQT